MLVLSCYNDALEDAAQRSVLSAARWCQFVGKCRERIRLQEEGEAGEFKYSKAEN
jgi:hypothetical protein